MLAYETKGIHKARKLFAEKLAIFRRSLATESDETVSDLLPEERASRLEAMLSFAYVGPTGEEPRHEWKDLGQEAIDCDPLPERSGYYAVVLGPYQTGPVAFLVHNQDYRDREPTRGASPAAAEERLRQQTFELSGLALAREARGREEAEARIAAARLATEAAQAENRLLQDRIVALEREKAEGGKGALIFERIAPMLNEAAQLVQRWDEREEAKRHGTAGNAKETAKFRAQSEGLLRLIVDIGGALAEIPAAAKDTRLRRLIRRADEDLQDLLDLDPEEEPVPEAQAAPTGDPSPAERPTQPAPPNPRPEPDPEPEEIEEEDEPAEAGATTRPHLVALDTPEARDAYARRAAERADQLKGAKGAARAAAQEMEERRRAAAEKEPKP